MNEKQLTDLANRIDCLQLENDSLKRRVRFFGLAAIGIAILMVAGGELLQNIGQFDAVEMRDGKGNLRCVLFADNGAGKSGFEIRDPKERVKFEVHTNKNDDPYINVYDVNGKSRIELGIAPNGDAYLFLRRGDGTLVHKLIAAD